VDRQAFGSELRYFKEGIALSAQLDYDQMLQGMNIASVQGSWQTPDNTVHDFSLDRRATGALRWGMPFFQDPALTTQARKSRNSWAPLHRLIARSGHGDDLLPVAGHAGIYNADCSQLAGRIQPQLHNVDAIAPVAVILRMDRPAQGTSGASAFNS